MRQWRWSTWAAGLGVVMATAVAGQDFGAVADGQADAAPVIQAAMDAVAAAGGGAVVLPAGQYRLGSALQVRDRVTLRGAGMGATVLHHGEGVRGLTGGGEGRAKLERVVVADLTFRGDWDQRPRMGTDADRHIAIQHIAHVRFENLEGIYGAQMGFTAGYCDKVEVLGCRVVLNARDGVNLTGSRRTVVSNCEFRHLWDDAIAIHTNRWSGAVPPGDHLVTNNLIEDSFGIKLLGANRAVVSGNIVTRPKGYGIVVGGHEAHYHEGNNDVREIIVSGNIVTDPINPTRLGLQQVVDFGIRVNAPAPAVGETDLAAPPGQFADGGSAIRPEAWWHRANPGGQPFSGGWRVLLVDNILARTLPAVDRYSAWGFSSPLNPEGKLFHCDGWRDDPMPTLVGGGSAIALHHGATQQVTIRGNEVDGWRDGVLCHSARRLWQVDIEGNRFTRISRSAVMLAKYPNEEPPADRNMLLRLTGNSFDLDPYHEHPNRQAGGRWQAAGASEPNALNASLVCGAVLTGNTFRNLNTPVHAFRDEAQVVVRDSRYFGEFAAAGTHQENRGVGSLLLGGEDLIQWEGSDPARSDFGRLLGAPPSLVSATAPTAGWYLAGSQVRCSRPEVREGRVISGWLRLTTGDGHRLGVDWAPLAATVAAQD